MYLCGGKNFLNMKSIFCSFCVGFFLLGCTAESFVDVLEVSFKSLSFEYVTAGGQTEERGIIIFEFLDGNGNIGAKDGEKSSSRIYYKWEKKISDGVFEPFMIEVDILDKDGNIIGTEKKQEEGSMLFPYRQVMDKDGANNRTLRGTIDIAILLPLAPADDPEIARIGFYIVDRNGKKSITKGTIRPAETEPEPTYTEEFRVVKLANGRYIYETIE